LISALQKSCSFFFKYTWLVLLLILQWSWAQCATGPTPWRAQLSVQWWRDQFRHPVAWIYVRNHDDRSYDEGGEPILLACMCDMCRPGPVLCN
jgi:hypothetical protein